jgi:hypothetical protein
MLTTTNANSRNELRELAFALKHEPLFRAVNVKHIQFLSFVVADLERTGPIRFCILGDGTAAVSTDSGFRENLRSVRRIIELSVMSLVSMLFADDGAINDEPVSLILARKFTDEDWHKTSRSAQAKDELRLRYRPIRHLHSSPQRLIHPSRLTI